MKLELGSHKPDHFVPTWPGQYEIFSHFEFACGLPHVLYAITTLKDNGLKNVCPSSWSSFTSGGDGFYAVINGLSKQCHTYHNILRDGEFALNFLAPAYYQNLMATIGHNHQEEDEMAAGGFTPEDAQTIKVPRIKEAFLSMECRLEKMVPVAGPESLPIVIGKVTHVAMDESYADALGKKYGADGFMLNINEPVNWVTGEGGQSAAAICQIVRVTEDASI